MRASSAGKPLLPVVASTAAGITTSISNAQKKRDDARSALALLDQNGGAKNPSADRLAALDTMLSAKKKEAITLTDMVDSLNILLENPQKSAVQLTATARTESSKLDTLLQVENGKKASLVQKRAAIMRDSIQNDSANGSATVRDGGQISVITREIAADQGEIDRNAAARNRAKQTIATIQEKTRQAQATSLAARTKTTASSPQNSSRSPFSFRSRTNSTKPEHRLRRKPTSSSRPFPPSRDRSRRPSPKCSGRSHSFSASTTP